jgi:Helix-turn-helix domain
MTNAQRPVAYSIPEAARAAAIGTTKLRNEIRAGRLACRKIGKRSVITAQDLEEWAAALPSIHDVAPATAATALKNFRKSA